MAREPIRTRRNGKSGSQAGAFFRLCRMLHAYVSAFAFLILLFFAVTGLTLNHPDWLAGRRPAEQSRTLELSRAEIEQAMKAPDPGRALAAAVGRRTPLVGGYASGDIADGQALIRLEGPRGVTDVTLTLANGHAEVSTRRASLIAMLNDLHKGKAAGGAWKLIIDVSAVLIIALSLVGYVLLFSLRLRLPLSLVLTALSLVALVTAALLLVA